MQQPSRSIRLGSLDVVEVIDRSPLGALGSRVIVLCGLAMMVDGYDVQVITYVAPVIAEALGITRSSLWRIFASGLVGILIGSLLFGTLADRFGRKLTLCGCILLFAICSLGTTTASGVAGLMTWRFFSGIGLGGTTPIVFAYAAEFCPARLRATATMAVACGFPVGAGGCGLIAAQMVPTLGWQSAFLLGGVVPLVLLACVVVLMPRSTNDLAQRGRSDLVAAQLERMAPGISVDSNARMTIEGRDNGFPVRSLFADGRTVHTLVQWLMFFMNILAVYFMVSWLPTLANASGLSVADAVHSTALSHLGSIIGTLTLAALVRRFDTYAVIATGYLFGAAMLVLLAFAGEAVEYFMGIAFFAGFFVIGTQSSANAVSGLMYPSSLRATGAGWALGAGRVGAILGASAGGLLIALHASTREMFIAAAGPALVASLSAFVLSRGLRRKLRSEAVAP